MASGRRMNRGRGGRAEAFLHDHSFSPRQPLRNFVAERIVAGDEADRDPPRAENRGIQTALANRAAAQCGQRRATGVCVGDGGTRVAGPGVIADEQGGSDPGVRPGAGDH